MLHLTNGDASASLIRKIGVTGDVVPWRDVLHEGPVPAGLPLESMSETRARFIASCRWGSFTEVWRQFSARDAALRAARQVVLWFEHDLYDQLQLVQILATVAQQRETSAELIAIDSFPGVEGFQGLAQLTPPQLASLWPRRRLVTESQLALGARAWRAFTSPDATAVRAFLATDVSAVPFLRTAFERLLEEYPAAPDGLSRTDRQVLTAVAEGHTRFEDVFRATQRMEAAPFLGDTVLQLHIEYLATTTSPLLTLRPLGITEAGRRVLAGELDARQLSTGERWLGGVRLRR